MPVPKKLLVLVLDAASPALLRRWAADGTLPTIAQLMATGLVGDTRSVEALYVGATWPSFYTAVNPGGHGFSWLDHLEVGTYRIQPPVVSDFARRETLWEILSQAGRRVLVLDVPLSRLSPDLNGVQIIEWGTHDRAFGFQTTPPGLRRTILATAGHHPAPANCDAPHRSLSAYRAFADQLARGGAARARLTRRLLADEPWEFAIQAFSESHCGGHQLWHFHDPASPAFDAAVTRESGDLLRQVYISLDSAVGAIVSDLAPETTVVLLTLHGMSHMSGASLLLPEILKRLGVTSPPAQPSSEGSRPVGSALVRGLRAAYHHVPERVRQPLYGMRRRFMASRSAPGSPIRIDPERTKCFCIDLGPTIGGIRLNLRGREPSGTLTRGSEADQFCAQLTQHVMEITEPGTGRRLARRVLRTAEHFRGAYVEQLPDLLVEWDLEQPVGNTVAGTGAGARVSGYSARVGLIEAVNTYCRTGEHRIEGMFVARGPGIVPGQLGRVVSNLDLAPTFARFFGVEMPGTDGQPIPELFE